LKIPERRTKPGPLGGLLPPLNLKEILRLLIVFGLGAIVVSVMIFKVEENSPEPRDWRSADTPTKTNNTAVSTSLYRDHPATMLVIGLLLLVSIVGGVLLAKEVD
jgi:NADH:ubiquinone oxidoreductase subunit 6 (subunit J)